MGNLDASRDYVFIIGVLVSTGPSNNGSAQFEVKIGLVCLLSAFGCSINWLLRPYHISRRRAVPAHTDQPDWAMDALPRARI